ncbi:MAG: ribosome maturation factor RimP [Myxococcota bacterium]
MPQRIATGKVELDVLEACEPVLASLGYECVHVEFRAPRDSGGRGVLRVFIDKEDGVNITDCAKASRQIDVVLDVEDVVPGGYTLEVSSPGIDRPLGRLADFERFAGKLAVVKTREAVEGRRNWTGKVQGVDGDAVVLDVDGASIRIPTGAIKKANLKYEAETAGV